MPGDLFAATTAPLQSPLQQLMQQFDALLKDEKRNTRRDAWISMEDRFRTLERKSKGDSAARAAFYHARSRQELARRSFLDADHKEAATRFSSTADKYSAYSVAPAALYRQGYILHKHLNDHASAVTSLERLIKGYPNAKGIEDARKLLAQAKRAVSAPAPAVKNASGEKSVAAKDSVKLKSIRWKGKGQKAIITLELDSSTEYEYSFIPSDSAKKKPGLLHLDIAGAVPSDKIKSGLKPQNLIVSRIRTSKSNEGVRVTFDCDDIRCYAVTTRPQEPQVIQIEVSRKDDIKDGIRVANAKASGKGAQKGGAAKSQDAVMKQLGLTVETIMLDAGHGGKDPGAIANNFQEKRFTLAMAKRVGALLQKEGFKVLYTRSNNTFISLQGRPDIANTKKADLFISIHVNANPNSEVRGLETYYLDSAKSQDAATVAARENAVSVKNISDLQFILTDLVLSSKLAESLHLAKCIHGSILKSLRAAKLSSVDNGVRSAPFYVLMGARMPAILVEFGYITNTQDAANLRSDAYLQRQAEGLVQGIKKYKQELARITQKK